MRDNKLKRKKPLKMEEDGNTSPELKKTKVEEAEAMAAATLEDANESKDLFSDDEADFAGTLSSAEDDEEPDKDNDNAKEPHEGSDSEKEPLRKESTFGVKVCNLNSLLTPVSPRLDDPRWKVFVLWPPRSNAGGGSAEAPVLEPHPNPKKRWDRWDEDHVKMPCSEQSLFPVLGNNGRKELQKRWGLITRALTAKPNIDSPQALEERVLSYNKAGRWRFSGLRDFFSEQLNDEERRVFFADVLPTIISNVMSTEKLITRPIPLLRRRGGQDYSCLSRLTFSQRQIACLLSNAFFCTYPRRNASGRKSEYGNYPDINFQRLFSDLDAPYQSEKLKCLLNYFRQISKKKPADEGLVTFERRSLSSEDFPRWIASKKTFTQLHVDASGTIEDNGFMMLQVDFANSYIGGGVLGHGCVQEEIRFLLSPELIASRLFTERLQNNECLVITGFERFSNYEGYSRGFRFSGNHEDATPLDRPSRHRRSQLVAIDALHFRDAREQFKQENIERELDKAYVGFYDSRDSTTPVTSRPLTVATGNWGCGAFGGDPYLKSLIQLMSASEVGRDVAYFTFGDHNLAKDLAEIHEFLVKDKVTVGQLMELLLEYQTTRRESWGKKDLFDYVAGYDQDTEDEVEQMKEEAAEDEASDQTSDQGRAEEEKGHVESVGVDSKRTPVASDENTFDDDVMTSNSPNTMMETSDWTEEKDKTTEWSAEKPVDADSHSSKVDGSVRKTLDEKLTASVSEMEEEVKLRSAEVQDKTPPTEQPQITSYFRPKDSAE